MDLHWISESESSHLTSTRIETWIWTPISSLNLLKLCLFYNKKAGKFTFKSADLYYEKGGQAFWGLNL
jgi:hypothetical protein